MSRTHPIPRGVERHLVVVLRADVHELENILPGSLAPISRVGKGIVLVDVRCRGPREIGPLAFGSPRCQLAFRIPVQRSANDAQPLGLWVARRFASRGWTPGALMARLPDRWMSSRAPRGANFELEEHGLFMKCSVQCEDQRVLRLEAETFGHLENSIFSCIAEAERSFAGWGKSLDAAPFFHDDPRLILGDGDRGLQPLRVNLLQSAELPRLFPGIEDVLELDSAFRVVRRRLNPIARSAFQSWRELSARRRLSAPPGGACVATSIGS